MNSPFEEAGWSVGPWRDQCHSQKQPRSCVERLGKSSQKRLRGNQSLFQLFEISMRALDRHGVGLDYNRSFIITAMHYPY